MNEPMPLRRKVVQAIPCQDRDGQQAADGASRLVEDQGGRARQHQTEAGTMKKSLSYFDLTDDTWPWVLVASLSALALLALFA